MPSPVQPYTYYHYKFDSENKSNENKSNENKSNDQLTITVDNKKHIAHITLITADPKKLKDLPSKIASSLVTKVEKELQIYARKIQQRYNSSNPVEKGKKELIEKCIQKIQSLKGWERAIHPKDHRGHELLRNHILEQMEESLLENRKLTNTFATGEGELNETLCEAQQIVKDHTFDSEHDITYEDQLDFGHVSTIKDCIVNSCLDEILKENKNINLCSESIRRLNDYFSSGEGFPPFDREALDRLFSFEGGFRAQGDVSIFLPEERSDFLDTIERSYQGLCSAHQPQSKTHDLTLPKKKIWRSQIHLGDPNDTRAYRASVRDAIDVISHNFNLDLDIANPSAREIVPGNRFAKLKQFCIKKLKGLRATMNKLAEIDEVKAETETELTPLHLASCTKAELIAILDKTEKEDYFMGRAKARWALFCNWNPIATHPEIKKQGTRDKKMAAHTIQKNHIWNKNIRKAVKNNNITLNNDQIEKLNIQLENLDLSDLLTENKEKDILQSINEKIQAVIKGSFKDNSEKFSAAILPIANEQLKKFAQIQENISKIKTILIASGHLTPDGDLISWIKDTLENYQLAQPEHPSVKPASFENPLSAVLDALKGINDTLVRYGEENPMITTTALAAFLFGGASILAPKLLEGILIKLHANGLIPAIGWSQNTITSNLGTDRYSVALGGLAYFGGVIALANIDTSFKKVIDILSESPVDIALFITIILAMPYGLNVISPTLGHFFEAGFSMPILIQQMQTVRSIYHAGYPSQGLGYKISAWFYKIYLLCKNTFISPIKEYILFRETESASHNNWLFNVALKTWPGSNSKGIGKYLRMIGAIFIGFFSLILPSYLVKFTFEGNIFFEFGITIFQKDSYSFLPEILKFKKHPDDFWYSPRVLFKYLIYSIRNFLVTMAHIVIFILKIIAFLISPFIPELFASKPFKKPIRKLFNTFKRAIGALLHFCVTLIQFLMESIPSYIHIVYRGICKLISKLLGTLAEPGKMVDGLWAGFKRPLSITDYFLDKDLAWRVSPNYGWGIFKDPALLKNWLLNPKNYFNGWFGPIKFLTIIALDIFILAFFVIKDIIRNPLLLLNDFLISPCLRLLVLSLDLLSRGMMFIFAVCFKLLDILVHFPKYLHISKIYTPGNLIKIIAEKFIEGTHEISFFFGGIKRSALGFTNELQAEIEDTFFSEDDNLENKPEERQAENAAYILQSLAILLPEEGKACPREDGDLPKTTSEASQVEGPESIQLTAESTRLLTKKEAQDPASPTEVFARK